MPIRYGAKWTLSGVSVTLRPFPHSLFGKVILTLYASSDIPLKTRPRLLLPIHQALYSDAKLSLADSQAG